MLVSFESFVVMGAVVLLRIVNENRWAELTVGRAAVGSRPGQRVWHHHLLWLCFLAFHLRSSPGKIRFD